ncbi:MAG TPA: hypothetical protein VGJ94_02595 [Syntrophorhabdaceae bacterium]|jgi:AAT family amino acid transporter
MSQFIVKRQFKSLLATGVCAAVACFVITLIYWPLWGAAAKAIISWGAGEGLAAVEPKVAAKYFSCFAEATFFWFVINAWIWHTLIFGLYGKTSVTERQPGAGIFYSLVGVLSGLAGFLLIVGFLGIWWKPFSFGILFTPQTASDVQLAIEGWEASNFFALTVIMVQIPFVSLLQKWPFAGNIKAPWDGFGVWTMSMLAAVIVWMGAIVPSFMKLSIGAHEITSVPHGSFPTFVAFCQGFIWCLLIPAEGGETYPMKFFAKKQPWMGLCGFVLALLVGFGLRALLRPVVTSLNLLPGAPIDLVIASLILSGVVAMLMWHHLFDDFPTPQMVPNQAARILSRFCIWVVLGAVLGVAWIKTFKMLPFGASDLGLGFPTMGILAGQFAFLMAFLYFNTFFDKWPLVRKVPMTVVQQQQQPKKKAASGR